MLCSLYGSQNVLWLNDKGTALPGYESRKCSFFIINCTQLCKTYGWDCPRLDFGLSLDKLPALFWFQIAVMSRKKYYKFKSVLKDSETVYCYCFWKIEQLGLHNEARIACSMSAPQQILSMQCMYSMISGVKLPLLTFLCRWLFNAVFLASGKAEHDIIRCPLTTFLRQKLWTQVTRTNKVVLDQ